MDFKQIGYPKDFWTFTTYILALPVGLPLQYNYCNTNSHCHYEADADNHRNYGDGDICDVLLFLELNYLFGQIVQIRIKH